MVTTVRGSSNDVEGHVHADLDDLSTSSVVITLRSASVDTRSAERDTHLRSADVFDVETYRRSPSSARGSRRSPTTRSRSPAS